MKTEATMIKSNKMRRHHWQLQKAKVTHPRANSRGESAQERRVKQGTHGSDPTAATVSTTNVTTVGNSHEQSRPTPGQSSSHRCPSSTNCNQQAVTGETNDRVVCTIERRKNRPHVKRSTGNLRERAPSERLANKSKPSSHAGRRHHARLRAVKKRSKPTVPTD